jgi:acetyl esterase/lipase
MYVWSAISYFLFVLPIPHIWSYLWLHSSLAATLNDMNADVLHALQYIRHDLNETQIVLAGYSSGAHVVSMILDPQMSTWTNIPHIVGILYISGVLSLDSSFMNLITLAVFGKWACDIPSPYTAPQNRGKRGIFPQTTSTYSCTEYTHEMRVAQPLPPFSLPPHLFIGCRHEIFGLPLLDATFCSQEYSDSLKKNDTCPTKCILLESRPSVRMNHWTILASPQFSQALDEHLPWLWDPSTTIAATTSTTTSVVLQEGTDTKTVAPAVDPTTTESQ